MLKCKAGPDLPLCIVPDDPTFERHTQQYLDQSIDLSLQSPLQLGTESEGITAPC
jgi:hypothetical protein